MSKDRLEDFISEHRNEFDAEIPGLDLWGKIDKELHPSPKADQQSASYINIGRAAAVVAIMFVACYWIFAPTYANSATVQHVNESPEQLLYEANPELAEISEYYNRKINKNKGRLAVLDHHDPDLYRDLNHMESMFDTLRMEWQMNPHKSDEKLVNAMIANLRTRSTLLENVVGRIEGHDQSFTAARPAVFRNW